jgi:perosamine synthetase
MRRRTDMNAPSSDIDSGSVARIVERLAQLLPDNVSLHEPLFEGRENDYVSDCIRSGWVSSVGSYVDKFEADLAAYTGAGYAVAVVNGTAALHLALVVAGVTAGDEVLAPALTFIATANAISYCGGVPHFVDSEAKSLGVDAEKLDDYLAENTLLRDGECRNRKTGARIKALICMHTLGHPSDLDKLSAVCRKYQLYLVEDAAESLGSFYKGRHTGNDGVISSLSFNGNKIMTTGGGGAVLTNDPEMAARAKHLSTTAKTPHAWEFIHDQIGFNYRMPNINAALGCAQLEQLSEFVAAKRALAETYTEAFRNYEGLEVFQEPDYAQSNYWLNALILAPERAALRDEILSVANARNIMTRPLWTPMHQLPIYAGCPRMDLSVAEDLTARTINIPSSVKLGRG